MKATLLGSHTSTPSKAVESGEPSNPLIRPNSRFIPEAERGWRIPDSPQQQTTALSSAQGAAAGGPSRDVNSRSSANIDKDKRRYSWQQQLSSLWNSPKSRRLTFGAGAKGMHKKDAGEYQEGDDDDDDDDDENEQDDSVGDAVAGLTSQLAHAGIAGEESDTGRLRRERSNSESDLHNLGQSSSTALKDRRTGARTPSQDKVPHEESDDVVGPLRLNLDLVQVVSRHHIEPTGPLTPSLLTQQNSKTPSLDTQRSTTQHESRGYAWKPEQESKHSAHIPPEHRNPTSAQAFYDTHFGSSSGIRSVSGIADEIFHPIGSAKKQVLSKIGATNGKRDKKKRHSSPGNGHMPHSTSDLADDGADSLNSWRNLPFSPAIFGMGGESPRKSLEKGEKAAKPVPGAYQAELIPTVHRDPNANKYFKRLEGNVVILGGYRGSILRDAATHQMIWVPLKVGVGLRRPTLEMGLDTLAEDNSEELVIADGMLAGIGNMVDTGKRLVTRCTRKKTNVHSWGYDWRKSLARSSLELEQFLQTLWQESHEDESKRRGAKVVAHSMGGLVALHALGRSQRPQIFESLVFASTPFLGTANILGPFAFGDAALWNDEICSPRATFSFRSSFYLLPVDPRGEDGTDTAGGRCFEEEDGTPHDIDFLDPENWNELGLSPCIKAGMRHEVLAKSKERAQHQGRDLDQHLERSASRRLETSQLGESPQVPLDSDKDKAIRKPGLPGPGLGMTASRDEGDDKSKKFSEAIKKAASGKHNDTDETLQPANRQISREKAADTEQSGQDAAEKQELKDDEHSESWVYLEKTLRETRQFFYELRTSFRQERMDQGQYPPISILTSGRTPTVRGALVWPEGSEALEEQEERARVKGHPSQTFTENHSSVADALHLKEHHHYKPHATLPAHHHWKRTARLGDYSRMLYAPGDGVILRRSATSMPGQWGRLLVREADGVNEHGVDPLTNDEGVVETSHRHVTLLSDVDGIGRCLEACRRARQNGWPPAKRTNGAASANGAIGLQF